MVDDIVTFLRPQDHRDHVVSEETSDFLRAVLAQVFALRLDFMHPNRDLRWAEFNNGNRGEDGIARIS